MAKPRPETLRQHIQVQNGLPSDPDEPVISDAEVEEEERQPHRHFIRLRWLAIDESRLVGNAALTESLNRQRVDLDHARADILSELSETRLLRGELENALRRALHGARIDLALPADAMKASGLLPRSLLPFRNRIGASV